MYPYLAMLALPAALALVAPMNKRLALLIVAAVYMLMIGFRFRVGMDWDNYLSIYEYKRGAALFDLIFDREPGYGLLMWIAAQVGGGMVFINAVASLTFCVGFFAVAKRCREPWLAVSIATPLLVIAFAMSGVRQAIAAGIIFYGMAHWLEYRTRGRILLVMLACSFHFSAVFVLIFVSLGAQASTVVRVGGSIVVAVALAALVHWAPGSVEAYSRLYVGSQGKLSAPGAIFQIAPLAVAALIYLTNRANWIAAYGDNPLYKNMAWGSIIAIPAIILSSVGAYRFALYFWPMAMTVYGGTPALITDPTGRALYRFLLLLSAFALLIGWVLLANNSYAWVPYRSWLFQPAGVLLHRPKIS